MNDARSVSYQATAITRQFPQLSLGGWWNADGVQQPMLGEVRNPLGILHIRLATWYRFDMLGIDQQDGHLTFEQVKNGSPIHPCCFEGNVGASSCSQPVQQRE